MAAVRDDEESLLPSGRESEDLPHGFEKTKRWQGRYRSRFQYRGIRTRVATFMTLAVLAIAAMVLWMVYVYRS